jgi:hypothetical protein
MLSFTHDLIVSARSPRQVDGWLPAAALELKDDDLSDIAAAIRAARAGTGPLPEARPCGGGEHRGLARLVRPGDARAQGPGRAGHWTLPASAGGRDGGR